MLREKGSFNIFYENLREVSVSFKNRGGVSGILIKELRHTKHSPLQLLQRESNEK